MSLYHRFLRGILSDPRQSPDSKAVTLFELILVIVVAALLAVLLVISTNFLIVRTKISRVKEEQRVLVRALQNYQMDYSNLPGESVGLKALVAPTAYLASVPQDPFQTRGPAKQYFYFSPDGTGRTYAVVSAGPDGKLDVLPFLNNARVHQASTGAPPAGPSTASAGSTGQPSGKHPATVSLGEGWFDDYLAHYTYDPTNGTVSAGDIVTVIVNY